MNHSPDATETSRSAGGASGHPHDHAARRLDTLRALFRRRWAAPVVAALHRRDGAKFATLIHATGASPAAIRSALDDLIDRGWVARNPGYGHPLRPEYVLTQAGAALGPACIRLDEVVAAMGVADLAMRRWSIPVLTILHDGPRRFRDLANTVGPVTDRALSQALTGLSGATLVVRSVLAGRPPGSLYAPTLRGEHLAEVVAGI